MTIAVTGGTGFVGQALIDRAVDEGREIKALVRRPQAPRRAVEWVRGDLDDKSAVSVNPRCRKMPMRSNAATSWARWR